MPPRHLHRPQFARHLLCAATALVAILAACGGGGGTSPDPAEGGGTPPDASAASLFIDPAWRTSNARIAVDAQGGRHAAYYYYEPAIEGRPTGAVYRFCAEHCERADAWQGVQLGTKVRSVQLKLTPDGHPRLLISADSTVYDGGKDYFYAHCDSGCTLPGGWTMTRVFSGRVPGWNLENDDELPQRSFALDAQGRPRFVVFDENQLATPQHMGLFYLACDDQCDQPARWQQTQVTVSTPYSVERVSQPVLALTRDGRPRIATAQFFPTDGSASTLMYFACDADCGRSERWGRVSLMERGGGAEPSVDLAIDADGRPRLAFFQEAMLEGQGKRLFYLACESGCLDVSAWRSVDLGLGSFNGQEPDLELDGQGRPRIAYADWDHGGIGYAWCDGDCAGGADRWQHRLLEDRDTLYRDWPVAYPPHCTGGLWNTLTPTLSLPAQGPAQIAYDATYHARCLYDHDTTDNIPPSSEMNLITRAARVVAVQ